VLLKIWIVILGPGLPAPTQLTPGCGSTCALALRAPANETSARIRNPASAACFQVREICITKV
jgi:hypothetical protein